MKTFKKILLAAVVTALAGADANLGAQSADSSTNKFSGTVTDPADKPVTGATVEYWRYTGNFFQPDGIELEKQVITTADGKFQFEAKSEFGFLIARSPGLAPAWQQLGQSRTTDYKLILTPPGTLAGNVVDESNRPVANAEVFVGTAIARTSIENNGGFNIFSGKPAQKLFSTCTDDAGRFHIENFPTNASAILSVWSLGKVLRPDDQVSTDFESAGCRAGQADIKLVVEPAGSIEGKIVSTDTNQAPPAGRLMLEPDERNGFSPAGPEPVLSGADGTFHFATVAAGSYHVHAVFGTNGTSEWVAEPAAVSIEAGQVTRGVQVSAQRGSLLEVVVTRTDDHKPAAKVNVNAFRQNARSGAQPASLTDSNGVARLHVLPGDYRVTAFQQFVPSTQASATVETGKTNRVEMEIAAPKNISGAVHNPDGTPAASVAVQLVGGYGPRNADIKTDAEGKFVLDWSARQFSGQSEATACVLVRDADRNLAAVQDIDEDTTNVDLKLAPALTLAGRVECDGKPVTNVTAQLVFWTGRSGSWLPGMARTNTPGQYEIPALPPGRKYGVILSAPGYGQKQNHNLEISADPGRQELDTVELRPANLKLAGQVLDADDKPVAGCNVNLNGDNQPNTHARTDHDGRFTFNQVCEGPVQLYANGRNSFGSIAAEGGDTNVILRLGQSYSSSPGTQNHKLTGTVTDAEGKPAAGAQVAVFPNNNGTHWIKTGTGGEYKLNWSLQPWQAQNGGAYLVVRDLARDLAAVEELPEDTTNLNVRLKPALTLTGLVKNDTNAPLPGAQMGLWFKAGNSYESVDEQMKPANAEGRFEIKCLPADGKYIVWASAKGYGKSQSNIENETETNRVELEPFVLKLADRLIAGQVLRDDDKPAAGVNVNLNGDGQPDGYMTTDSKGRFHFQVCEGQIRLFAYAQNGGGNAQASVEAGDTNIVMNLSSPSMGFRETPRRASLKGNALPDLASVNLTAEAVPANQAVLLCLFDASQRPSRHVVQVLAQKAETMRQKNVSVLAVQSAVIPDDTFNDWKTAVTVPFPVGRVTEKSEKARWASNVTALPWLILADAHHRVVAEGFSLDETDAQIEKLAQ